MKDRDETELRLIKSVGRVLADHGFSGLGINLIAKEAGVDKVLIYRYFGGLPQLLARYASSTDFWPSAKELKPTKPVSSAAALGKALLQGHVKALRKRPLTQEIMRWELLTRNALTDELARHREALGNELMASLAAEPTLAASPHDLPAIAALLHAGLTYLLLREKTVDVYMGVPLGTAAGDRRLARAIEQVLTALLPSEASPNTTIVTPPTKGASHAKRVAKPRA